MRYPELGYNLYRVERPCLIHNKQYLKLYTFSPDIAIFGGSPNPNFSHQVYFVNFHLCAHTFSNIFASLTIERLNNAVDIQRSK